MTHFRGGFGGGGRRKLNERAARRVYTSAVAQFAAPGGRRGVLLTQKPRGRERKRESNRRLVHEASGIYTLGGRVGVGCDARGVRV